MWKLSRVTLARVWRSLWQRRDPVGARKIEGVEDRGPGDARARFWTEFREGQRAADARAASLRPAVRER